MDAYKDRLIIALDVSRASEAQKIVNQIGDSASTYKVGKQLFTAEGPQVVRDLVASGRDVFLDLKYHDIPNTVAGAVRMASQLGVRMLTVHASGGLRMMKAAVEAAGEPGGPPLSLPGLERQGGVVILAVTVLTSLKDEDMAEIGVSGRVLDQALR